MFIRMIARAAIVVSTFTAAASAKSEILYETNVGGWSVGAHVKDTTGEFTHCSTYVPYRSGMALFFGIGKDFKWRMGLAHPQWKLTAGATYPVLYQIDSSPAIAATATAHSVTGVGVELIDTEALFSAFQRGRTLRVITAGQTFSLDLTNSSKALAATLSCTRTNVAAIKSNPFVTGAVPADNPQRSDEAGLKAEAATFTANLLSAAGIAGFRMMSEVPQELEGVHAIWAAPGLLGGVAIDSDSTVEQASTMAIASSSHRCKGRFASARLPEAHVGAASIETVCEELDGKVRKDSIILAPRKAGGVYVFVTFGDFEANAEMTAQDAGGRLLEASYKVLEP